MVTKTAGEKPTISLEGMGATNPDPEWGRCLRFVFNGSIWEAIWVVESKKLV